MLLSQYLTATSFKNVNEHHLIIEGNHKSPQMYNFSHNDISVTLVRVCCCFAHRIFVIGSACPKTFPQTLEEKVGLPRSSHSMSC